MSLKADKLECSDSLGQVKSGKRYWNDGTPVAGQQFEYAHDDIGNRTSTKAGGDAGGANLRSATYTRNRLNQYTQRDVLGAYDVMGAARGTVTITGTGSAVYRKDEYFRKEVTVANTAAAVWNNVTVTATAGSSVNSSGNTYVPKTAEVFTYDLDGNVLTDGRWTYTWDGENRLTRLVPISTVGPQTRIDFEYDWQGRRIAKKVWNNVGGTGTQKISEKFLYDGWNLISQLNASNNAVVRSYVWGSDLSGSLQGAGGVGGLLAVKDTANGTHFAAYDGNGNVVALVSAADASVSARYEYGPFGELLRGSGTLAKLNPFRFSTKFQDDETDQLYYGYRYLSPSTGRWLGRDPIEEAGGKNVMGFVNNSPLNMVDKKGLNALVTAVGDCAKSIATKWFEKYLDQQYACRMLANRIRGDTPNPGEQDAFDIDLCKGFSFAPGIDPGYSPTSFAEDIRDCVLSSLKGAAIDELLKGITDPNKRELLKDLLEKAADDKPEAKLKLTISAKCVSKRAQVTLNYTTSVSAKGKSVDLDKNKVGPFGCSVGTQLFGGVNLDSNCACCAK